MKIFTIAALLFTAALALPAQVTAPTPPPRRPIPAVEHVLIIIVDGLRPDVLLLAEAPTLHALARGGAYSFWARTTDVAVTLPSCTSMLTGVSPRIHGVTWNSDLPAGKQVYPLVPTVFELATRAGYVTALVAGKSKFAALNQPGTITHAYVPATTKVSDEQVTAEAVKVIAAYQPALLCVHYPDVDGAGHAKGWGSREQLSQISHTDEQIGLLLGALERAGMRGSTVVLVSADHGGAGRSHGANDLRSRYIPWIVAGPGVRPGYDLTQAGGLQVTTEDTCATVCWLLGLPPQPHFDGHPVTAAFEPGL